MSEMTENNVLTGENNFLALPQNKHEENIFREAIYTGRIELNQTHGQGEYCEYDIKSFYPKMMLNEYPYGTTFHTSTKNPDLNLFGIYKVIMKPNVKSPIPILPRKDKNRLVWDYEEYIGYYTNIDIKLGKKYGYKFEFLGEGVYWNDACCMFKNYIETLYREREEYPIAKLVMNCLYGALFEKPNIKVVRKESKTEKSVWNENEEYYEEFNIPEKSIVPVYLSAFMLSYSREYLYKCLKKIDFQYVRLHTDGWICLRNEKLDKYVDDKIGLLKRTDMDEFQFENVNRYKFFKNGIVVKQTRNYE